MGAGSVVVAGVGRSGVARVDDERSSDDATVGEAELGEEPVGAGSLEPDVQAEVGAEAGAGDRQDRAALVVGGLGVTVREAAVVGRAWSKWNSARSRRGAGLR